MRGEGEDHIALVGELAVGHTLLDHAAVAGAGQGAFQGAAEELLDVRRVELFVAQVALEQVQQIGGEGGDGRALGHFGVGLHQALHRAFAGHGDLLAGDVDHTGVGAGDEVQVVQLVEDEGEGADADHEDRRAQGHRAHPADEAHAAAAGVLAFLGEVLALQGVEHVADADHFAGEERGDHVAQRGDVSRLEALELAAGAAGVGVEVAYLEFHFKREADAVDLEQQLAAVHLAHLHRRVAGAEGEAAGGKVDQARIDAFAMAADEADACRQLDPRMAALGFGFVHDVEVDGCIHGQGSCHLAWLGGRFGGHTMLISTATKTLAAEKVMARDDQVLNQRWKLARPRSSLVFWRVHDCWSRRKKT
ncbi:hypothetical protein D3C81_1093470 [compost metagenome]